MELNIAAALKQPSETFEAVIEERLPDESYCGRIIKFTAPARLEFRYSYDGEAITLKGSAVFALEAGCARCDEAFIEMLDIPLDERFVKGGEEDAYAFDGETIKLGTMMLDNLFLHMPITSVCSDDCKGLCPVCGTNLNTAKCDCVVCDTVERDNPFSALGSIDKEEV